MAPDLNEGALRRGMGCERVMGWRAMGARRLEGAAGAPDVQVISKLQVERRP